LIERGADVNATDIHGNTPLIYAARVGDAKTCMLLVGKGANMEAKDEEGKTASMHADESIEYEYLETAASLKSMKSMQERMGEEVYSKFISAFGECTAA
jgi:ankyrin repeat protein